MTTGQADLVFALAAAFRARLLLLAIDLPHLKLVIRGGNSGRGIKDLWGVAGQI
jgi:hypothetical protein